VTDAVRPRRFISARAGSYPAPTKALSRAATGPAEPRPEAPPEAAVNGGEVDAFLNEPTPFASMFGGFDASAAPRAGRWARRALPRILVGAALGAALGLVVGTVVLAFAGPSADFSDPVKLWTQGDQFQFTLAAVLAVAACVVLGGALAARGARSSSSSSR